MRFARSAWFGGGVFRFRRAASRESRTRTRRLNLDCPRRDPVVAGVAGGWDRALRRQPEVAVDHRPGPTRHQSAERLDGAQPDRLGRSGPVRPSPRCRRDQSGWRRCQPPQAASSPLDVRDVEGSTGVGGAKCRRPKCRRPKQSNLGSSPPSISTPRSGPKTTSAPSNSPGRSRAATRGRPPVQMPQAIFPSGGTHPFRSFPVLRSFTGVTLFRSGAEPLRRRHRRPHGPALPIRRSAGSRHLLLTDRAVPAGPPAPRFGGLRPRAGSSCPAPFVPFG